MGELELGDRLGEMRRLVEIRRLRPAMRHVAEWTAPSAQITEDHECRRTVAEALADIRARGLLADGVQAPLAQYPLHLAELGRIGQPHTDPLRLLERGRRRNRDHAAPAEGSGLGLATFAGIRGTHDASLANARLGFSRAATAFPAAHPRRRRRRRSC